MMTRKIVTQEFLVRLTQLLMFLSIILIIIVIIGDIKIKSMEQPAVIRWEDICKVKESVKEQATHYRGRNKLTSTRNSWRSKYL